jgi:hypothetical protein
MYYQDLLEIKGLIKKKKKIMVVHMKKWPWGVLEYLMTRTIEKEPTNFVFDKNKMIFIYSN